MKLAVWVTPLEVTLIVWDPGLREGTGTETLKPPEELTAMGEDGVTLVSPKLILLTAAPPAKPVPETVTDVPGLPCAGDTLTTGFNTTVGVGVGLGVAVGAGVAVGSGIGVGVGVAVGSGVGVGVSVGLANKSDRGATTNGACAGAAGGWVAGGGTSWRGIGVGMALVTGGGCIGAVEAAPVSAGGGGSSPPQAAIASIPARAASTKKGNKDRRNDFSAPFLLVTMNAS